MRERGTTPAAPKATKPHPRGFAHPSIDPRFGYRPLGAVLRATFGERVRKIALDGGYTCPNRDGTLAEGGCVYCAEGSRGMIARVGDLERQFRHGAATRPERRYIVYFQAYSGTYAPLPVLRSHWSAAVSWPGVVGLAVSTRPDCLPEPVLELLAELHAQLPVWVELGLESARDTTLRRLNRAHDVATFVVGVERLAAAGIPVVAHLIAGLPQEPPEALLEGIALLRSLPIWGIKLHPFHVVAGSPLAQAWRRRPWQLLELEAYAELAAEALAYSDPAWVIHRVTGAAPADRHLAPAWCRRPRVVEATVRNALRRHGWIQGCLSVAAPIEGR